MIRDVGAGIGYGLLAFAVLAIVGWFVFVDGYRQQHCIQFLGHWIATGRGAALPMVCE